MRKTAGDTSTKDGKLKFGEKFGVGMGGLSSFMGNALVQNMAVPFYQMMLGMNPVLLGTLLAIPRFWDAFTDPFMGKISDNFRSRYGRRRPFIFIGAALMALSFGMIWMVPSDWSETAMAIWFVVTGLCFFTCFTIFYVPFTSLTFELTSDYDERTSVMAYTTFWSKIGELAYQWIIPIASLSFFASQIVGVRTVCWIIGFFAMFVAGSMPAFFGKERYYEVNKKETQERGQAGFWKTAKDAFQTKAFAILLGLTFIQILSGMLGTSLDYYLLVYYMNDGDIAAGSFWKGIISSGYAIMGFVALPLVTKWAKKTDKLTVLRGVYCMALANAILRFFIFQPGNELWLLVDPILGSIFWIAYGTVKQSMMADICDQDELEHGQRREGMFGAIFGWITKSAISMTFFLSGIALVMVGFDESLGGNQSPETFMGMRLTMSLGGAIPALAALILLKFYPLTRQRSEEIKKELEHRRGEV